MIRVRWGQVVAVEQDAPDVQELRVRCPDGEGKAINFPTLTGTAHPGDAVALNTTAVSLRLGTGGYHFVMAISGQTHDVQTGGHIMKVRYTPAQVRVLAVEEEDSAEHQAMCRDCHLSGMPVAVATLHSLVAPFAVAFKQAAPSRRLAYIMTDGAALPAQFSRLIKELHAKSLLDTVITCGHAFGGDIEAVTPYSAMQAAQTVAKCDACIVAMGPGVVGTGTPLGTTALEQAPLLDGAAALGAYTLAIPRISFADPRPRQQGLSHHTATALGCLAQLPTRVIFPELPVDQKAMLTEACRQAGIIPKHTVLWVPVPDVVAMLDNAGVQVTSMGRTPAADPVFFAAAAAAGITAAKRCTAPCQ